MSIGFQPSLLDTALDGVEHIGVGPIADRIKRTELSDGAWVDVLPGWFEGADDLFTELVESIPWRAERRPMYDNVVDVRGCCTTTASVSSCPIPRSRGTRCAERPLPAELGSRS